MKTKHLLLLLAMLLLTGLTTIAQNVVDKANSQKENIPFGKKLPPPDLTINQDKSLPHVTNTNTAFIPHRSIQDANAVKKNPDYYRQLLLERRKMQTSLFDKNEAAGVKAKNENSANSNFHLIKDINTLSESNPDNYTNDKFDISDYFFSDTLSFAVLNNIIYFIADDGIHGNELWRSDGTDAGTFLFKDFTPGIASSYITKIIAAGGKIYFMLGSELWVSNGTDSGTQPLGVYEAGDFFTYSNKLYFIADSPLGYKSAIWQTDGTIEGTQVIIDFASRNSGGEQLGQPTIVNGLLFFTFLNYDPFGWQIWRSDLTEAGTYNVSTTFPYDNNTVPAQLTAYNNKLYFSANDGSGRKLWVSDGTNAGTKPAPGNHGVIIGADYTGKSFPVVNNILCVPGGKPSHGNGLYKYDASDGAGLVKIKDFAPDGVTAFIIPKEMQVVNNTLYFKVTNYTGGVHDELWSSKGTSTSTQLVISGEVINNLYIGNGTLYFVKGDRFFGAELWKIFNTPFGSFPIIESDIFKGLPGSHPSHLTAFKGRLIFSAANEQKGNELFITNSFGFGATLVKDIKNDATTSTSLAGYNPYNYFGYTGMITLGKDVLFTAYERVHGKELYKSDGTSAGTKLLNDIIPGDAGFDALSFISKNNAVYFVAISKYGSSIYKTNGTKNSLQKITPDHSFIITFAVADNGLVFYSVYNYGTAAYELWRSDGTTAGTWLLSSTIYFSVYSYLNTAGNTAFFVAGDATHGYELWKSDGSVAGTKLLKDINPGIGNSNPAGMFAYKNEVYFAAYNGIRNNFYKSDGTESGTIKLKNIDPWYGRSVSLTEQFYFEVSNNILYFAAVDTSNTKGTQFWRTDGTVAGTQVVKDLNPNANDYYANPSHLTDVNGTLFFIGNDGVNGTGLWKSNGTKEGTQFVKGIGTTIFYSFASCGGKLFFSASVNGVRELWYSDGTADGTQQITDAGISGVNFIDIYCAGNKLVFSGYTSQYGLEVYAGKVNDDGKFVASKISTEDAVKTTLPFNAILYPNPVVSNAMLQITGSTKNVSISITDMSGKKLWQSSNINAMLIKLPTEKYTSGTYLVTVTNGKESKTIKLVKQ